jgi:pSer/pThr/pTyr-binding forkhead associated (FHA) protein
LPDRDIALPDGETVLGRDADCHVPLEDGLASRRHVALHVADGRVTVEDLGSRNGTMLDGRLIGYPVVATHSSKLTIGGTSMTLLDSEKQRARAETKPSVTIKRASSTGITAQSSHTIGTNTAVPDLAFVDRARDALMRGALDECAAASAIVVRRQANLGPRAIETVVRDVSVVLLGLARRTGDRGWLDGVFQVHAATGRPIANELVDSIADLPAKGTVKYVREYLEKVRERPSLSHEELVALERIEKLAS